jgi:alanyl-tRNA synthetase
VARTGDIGLFKVVAESGVAAGIRRIEAVTGDNALTLLQSVTTTLDDAAAALKVSAGEVPAKLSQVLDSVRSLEKEVARLKSKLAASQGDDLASQAVDVAGIKVLAARLEGADARVLRETIDQLKSRLGSAAIVLASVEGGKVSLIAGVTQDATARVKAGDLVNHVAQQVGGKGGGRADMAQAGGTQPDRLPAALAGVADWVASKAG